MKITFFSFYMAVIWSNLFILFLYLFRKKFFSISFISISGMLLIYLLCMVRIALPIELSFAKIVISKNIYNTLTQLMNTELWNENFRVSSLLLVIWMMISISFFIHLFYIYYKFVKRISICEKVRDEKLQNIIDRMNWKKHKKIEILVSHSINVPMSFGIFKNYILLPNKEYDSKQAYYILMHEYTHLKNGDQIIKLLVNIIQCIYWWNPLIYFMSKDLEQILEIKCDITVIQKLDNKQKADYLDTILSSIKNNNMQINKSLKNSNVLESYLFKKSSIGIIERFQIVAKYKNMKNKKIKKILLYIFAILSLCFSYSFVIQSEFEAPINDIETEGKYEINISENYIYKDKNGNYWIEFPDKKSEVLDEQTALRMIEIGFQMKKE